MYYTTVLACVSLYAVHRTVYLAGLKTDNYNFDRKGSTCYKGM